MKGTNWTVHLEEGTSSGWGWCSVPSPVIEINNKMLKGQKISEKVN